MDPYQLNLLDVLAQSVRKVRPLSNQRGAYDQHRPSITEIELYRQLFEAQLLILLEYNLKLWRSTLVSLTNAREVQTELNILFDILEQLVNREFLPESQVSSSPDGSLEHSGKYPHLERMLLQLQQSRMAIEITGVKSSSLFTILSLANAKAAHQKLQKVNRLSKQLHFDTSVFATPSSNALRKRSVEDSHCKRAREFGMLYQEQLGNILDTMRLDFAACERLSGGGTHKIFTQLILDEIELLGGHMVHTYMFCPVLNDWQAVSCNIERERQGTPTQHTRLCRHLQSAQRLGDGLALRFHENLNIFVPDPDSIEILSWDTNNHSSRSLKELIEVDNLFNLPWTGSEFKEMERQILATKLVLHLSMFGPWRHTSAPWESSSVCFLQSSANELDRATPYISWQIGLDSTIPRRLPGSADHAVLSIELEEELEEETRVAIEGLLVESFTELAKLLLEVRYGPMNRDHHRQSLRVCVRNYWREIQKEADPIQEKPYLEAIDTCLRFPHWYEQERTYQEMSQRNVMAEEPEDTYRRLVLTKIVSKLLQTVWSGNVMPDPITSEPHAVDDDESSSDSDEFFDTYEDDIPRYHEPPPSTESNTGLLWPETSLKTSSRWQSSKDARLLIDEEIDQAIAELSDMENGHLQDGETDPESVEVQRRRTDKWFDNFSSLVKRFKTGRAKRLKLAILDSGINYDHSHFNYDDTERIIERKSFIGGDPNVDNVGHGTHIAAIILRLTQNVDLYIAKVTDTKAFSDKIKIAEAIKHARDVWKVDMISLSFGFDIITPADGIQKQINLCLWDSEKPIVVFSSASNDGAEGSRTWPAKCEGVICVYSAKQRGQKADCNPPWEGNLNLSFVGENVRPIWGRKDLEKSEDMPYESGTSYATPVAVSIAAFMIAFIQIKGWDNWAWMYPPASPQGIVRIFQMMSVKADGYDWVSPTRFVKYNSMKYIEGQLEHKLVKGRD